MPPTAKVTLELIIHTKWADLLLMRSLANWEANGNKIDPFLLILAHNVHKQQSKYSASFRTNSAFRLQNYGWRCIRQAAVSICRSSGELRDDSGTLVSVNLWMRWGLRCFHFHMFENSEAQYIKSSKGGMLRVDRSNRGDKEKYSIGLSSRWRDDTSSPILSNTATELIVIIDPVLHSEWCTVLISLFPSFQASKLPSKFVILPEECPL